MDKWKITSVVLGLVIMLSVFYLLNNNIAQTNYQKEVSIINSLSDNFRLSNQMTGIKIDDMELDKGWDKVYLSSMTKENPVFIYRYTEETCSSCIEKDLVLLNDCLETGDSTYVCVFGSYHSRRDYLMTRSNRELKFPLYNVQGNSLSSLELEDYGISYCFLLHPNMKISNVFIPDQAYPDLTRQYFAGIKRFLDE